MLYEIFGRFAIAKNQILEKFWENESALVEAKAVAAIYNSAFCHHQPGWDGSTLVKAKE